MAAPNGAQCLPCQRAVKNMSKRKTGNSSQANAKGRSKGDGRFVKLDYGMLDCPAGKSLRPGELAILVRMMQRYHGENNGRIAFSCRDAARLAHVGKDTAAKHIRALCRKGFVRVKKQGAFNRNGSRATEYILTMFPTRKGHPASRDFQNWQPPEKPKPKNKSSYKSKDAGEPKSGHKPKLRVVG